MKSRNSPVALLVVPLLLAGCQPTFGEASEIARLPVDSLEGVLTRSGVSLDTRVSSDGGGSLRIEAHESTVVRLYELRDIDVDNARLLYRARLRSEALEGRAYLEMWCHFEGLGEFFSRGLANPLTGTVDWSTHEIPFFLRAGENPDLIKLNVAVNGRGTVWIDDIVLSKGPLE
jgi:hypothetical protein